MAETRIDESATHIYKVSTAVLAVVVVVATFIAGWQWLGRHNFLRPHAPAEVAVTPWAPREPARPAPEAQGTPAPVHPVAPEIVADGLTLESSDAALLSELEKLTGSHGLLRFFHPTELVRRIVATVDALPRHQVPLQVVPTLPVPGRFIVESRGGSAYIGPANPGRYVPYVHLLTSIDPKAAAGAYRRFYPLFQQAYRQLGYPTGYFNDRLVEVIDDALATPKPPTPLHVEAPRAMWQYADPDLEDLSAGQKILLRMGLANADAVRSWIRAFREAIA